MSVTKQLTHIPPGFTAVTPYLTVADPDVLVAFAKAAFGAEELRDQRASGSDGKTTHTAFRVEGCIIETGRASGEWKTFPASLHSMFETRTRHMHAPSRPEE